MHTMHRLCLAALAICAALSPSFSQERRGGAAGDFDFYVLALSWSPSFCASEGRGRASTQCESRRNPGFVLHGLWPQFERGFPSHCEPEGRSPSRAAIEIAEGVFPEAGLARYQWRKHGTCSGESPSGYFEAAKRAKAMVTIPSAFTAPREALTLSPQEVERAFTAANPGLRANMMGVACNRSQLDEVRICLTKDLRSFRACGEVDQRTCRVREITVPAAP